MGQNNKRRIYYLKNTAQSKFISRFLMVSLLGGVAAVAAFNFLAYKKIDAVLYSMRFPKVTAGGLLWNEMLYTNIFVAVFVIIVFAWTAKALFVKVHGPLKKLTSDISKIGNGDLAVKVSLREKDEFQDFADDLNQTVSALRTRFKQIQEKNNLLLNCLETPIESPEATQKVKQLIEELNKAVEAFKI